MDYIEVESLDGTDLDYWFARSIGCTCMDFPDGSFVVIDQAGSPVMICSDQDKPYHVQLHTSWSEVGHVFQERGYSIVRSNDGGWEAELGELGRGATPLLAFMRGYVLIKAGARVPATRPNLTFQRMSDAK